MSKKDLKKFGSETAKGGFRNEDEIIKKLNNWNHDKEAKQWLEIMGYLIQEIEKVEAIKLHGYKTDVQIQITIYLKKEIVAENLSIKLVSNPHGFNQIDKRWVDKYVDMWEIPADIRKILKIFTDEICPNKSDCRDQRRMFLNEMEENDQKKVIDYFSKNKILVVSDLLKGRGRFSAGWMLVALVIDGKSSWILKSINQAMNIFAHGAVRITKQGNLKIGGITMQRKGGDGGRDSAKMLQFKINPVDLFKN